MEREERSYASLFVRHDLRELHAPSWLLHALWVWCNVEDAEVSSQTMPAEPSVEFSRYFDHHGYLRRAERHVGMEVRSHRAR